MPASTATIHHALSYHQAGQLQEAAIVYREILSVNPKNADALHLFGLLVQQSGNPQQALPLLQQAVNENGKAPTYYNSLGNLLQELCKWEEAIQCYQKALKLAPKLVDTYCNLGLAYHQTNRSQEAMSCFQEALRLSPNLPQAHNNLGLVLKRLGDVQAAQGHYEEALRQDPAFLEGWVNLGELLQESEDWARAEAACHRALALDAGCPEALTNLALILQETGRPQDALQSAKRAIQEAPENLTCLINLGSLYYQQGLYSQAIDFYQTLLPQIPATAEIYQNLGMCLRADGKLPEAIQAFRDALSSFAEEPDLHFHLALALLQSGQWTEGFQEYEWRFQTGRVPASPLPFPKWEGSPLQGKTLLVTAEQGYGDTLQFVRYLNCPQFEEATLILRCQPGLKTLLQGFTRISQVFELHEPLPAGTIIDFQVSTLSLPRVLAATVESIPKETPYLIAPSESVQSWDAIFSETKALKVGIVWSGSPTNKAGGRRNCPLREFLRLARHDGIQLYSLQKGPASETLEETMQAADLAPDKVIDLSSRLTDFAETAAALEHLDLVITVDTSVAHLAGALGRPVWAMLPDAADWRWLQHSGTEASHTPWYPSMKLFHQPAPGNWAAVIDQIQWALAAMSAQ